MTSSKTTTRRPSTGSATALTMTTLRLNFLPSYLPKMQKAVPDTGVYDAKGWWERGKRESVVEKFHSAKIKKKNRKSRRISQAGGSKNGNNIKCKMRKFTCLVQKHTTMRSVGKGALGGGGSCNGVPTYSNRQKQKKVPGLGIEKERSFNSECWRKVNGVSQLQNE